MRRLAIGILIGLCLAAPSAWALRIAKPAKIIEWNSNTFTILNDYLEDVWNVLNGRIDRVESLDIGTSNDNYLSVSVDGELELKGTATVWNDIRVPLSSLKRLGFTDPDWEQFQDDGAASTGVYAPAFATNADQEVFFAAQLPHDWKLGSDLQPHVHWSPSDANAGNVTWKLEYTISDINGTFGNTSTISVTDAADTVALKHQIVGFSSDIDMSSYTDNGDVSIMLICRLYRDVSDGDTYGSDAFLLETDFHYEIDSLGSTEATSK